MTEHALILCREPGRHSTLDNKPPQYMSNVDSWCKACGEVDLPSELQDLEDAIHHHQGVYEHVTLAYSEVSVQLFSRGGQATTVCFCVVTPEAGRIKGLASLEEAHHLW